MKRIWFILLYLFVLILISGCLSKQNLGNETEAAEYMGIKLTPISEQGNNAIKGTQFIDKDAYRLKIEGMVERPANFTYNQITTYTPVSKVVNLNCVEGWGFTAKWTGVTLKTLLDITGIKENATNVIFYSTDGYSTSHHLDYLIDNNIMLAYRINDITLPPDRGFPLQLVAEGKYGYKWAKWIDHIELVNSSYKGYWESRGYNNKGDFGGPPYEQ
ncbi:MAG: oxidoreductase [Candidatus Methanoperedenaceae archaeon]|nr:MAG: oxidoreductase [Candidatus Methanoperedenaceae archaeon]